MVAPLTIIVTPDAATPQRGTLRCGSFVFPCVLGRSGVTSTKHEGDGATPAGRYPLRRLLYRADRLAAPDTALPSTPIAHDDGWCDDPADPGYNRAVKLPYGASAEAMWRDEALYDLVVIIGHNDNPIVPGAGSAIFLHVARENEPTAGCVALRREDLLAVLKIAGSDGVIDIRRN